MEVQRSGLTGIRSRSSSPRFRAPGSAASSASCSCATLLGWAQARHCEELLLPLDALVCFAFQRLPDREQKDCALLVGVRRKKLYDLVVEKGESARAQAQGINGQIHFAADGSCFQLDGAVAAVSVCVQDVT